MKRGMEIEMERGKGRSRGEGKKEGTGGRRGMKRGKEGKSERPPFLLTYSIFVRCKGESDMLDFYTKTLEKERRRSVLASAKVIV